MRFLWIFLSLISVAQAGVTGKPNTVFPTASPSAAPQTSAPVTPRTEHPSNSPTTRPTVSPTKNPTPKPSLSPSTSPTRSPTSKSPTTVHPTTLQPTHSPTPCPVCPQPPAGSNHGQCTVWAMNMFCPTSMPGRRLLEAYANATHIAEKNKNLNETLVDKRMLNHVNNFMDRWFINAHGDWMPQVYASWKAQYEKMH